MAKVEEIVQGPYGTVETAKGFTGQYSDPLTGLDYYVARYYDPVAGVFLSADTKEGNAQGMNPYAYVAQNPETLTDPRGQMYYCPQGCGGGNNGNPTPPPTPQPHAPGHGYTPPGQCSEGPGMCDGNSNSCNASHIGAMVCGSLSLGNQPSGSCNAQCVANDKARIESYWLKQQALSNIRDDAAQLGGDIAALILDILSDNWVAVAFDLIASLIPHVAGLVNDIMIATGHGSPQLQQFLTFLKGMSDYLTFMKGLFFLIGGISQLMTPVLNVAAKMAVTWVVSGLGSMWSAAWGAPTINPPDPNSLFIGKSPTQIQDLCIYDFGEGQGC